MNQCVRMCDDVLRERIWRQAAGRNLPVWQRTVRQKAAHGPAALLLSARRWEDSDERTPPCGHCTQCYCSGTDCQIWREWWGYHFRRLCRELKRHDRRWGGEHV